jgi:hypothetical protein
MKATGYTTRDDTLAGWPVRVTSYCIGDCWYASVENVDPGAKIARAEASSREEAERAAIEKAKERLARTRKLS